MEFATDHLIARLLLTVNTLGYGLATILADFNQTHATNPLWTPHARFHVVWQVLSYAGIGLIALGLIWIGGPTATMRLWLAVAIIAAVYISFFATVFAMPLFGGSVADKNGIPPITTVTIGGKDIALDVNVTVFCGQVALFAIALALIAL